MTVSVAVPRARGLSLQIIEHAGSVAELRGRARDYGWLVRVATAGALVYSVYPAVNDVALISTAFGDARNGLWALISAACFLPLHVRNVWYATHARIPPAGLASLVVMGVVIIGALPVAGDAWLRAFGSLAVSAWIVLRPPWSRPVVAVLLIVPLVLALVRVDGPDGWWIGSQPFLRATMLFALVWLAAAVRQLQEARQLFADQALTRERDRLDDELQRSLGVALESIVARGQRALVSVGADERALKRDLRELVDGSRSTLAEARRLIRGYRVVSLQDELDMAGRLLTAAGIETTVVPHKGRLAADVEQLTRDALRATAGRLLRDGTVRSCTISVTPEGRLNLDVHADAHAGGVAGQGAR